MHPFVGPCCIWRRIEFVPCGVVIPRLLREEGYVDDAKREQFVTGMMKGVPGKVNGYYNKLEVAKRFGGDVEELVQAQRAAAARRKRASSAAPTAGGESSH